MTSTNDDPEDKRLAEPCDPEELYGDEREPDSTSELS